MFFRALVVGAVVVASGGGFVAENRVAAAPGDAAEPVALVVEGTGYGHGRGMSQWGSYGWAVNNGWSWTRILDHYYGGTTLGDAPADARVRVRLAALDGARSVGVVSQAANAVFHVHSRPAWQAVEVSEGTYDLYSSASRRCPNGNRTGWNLHARNVKGPITFVTPGNESTLAAGDTLGLCRPDGTVVQYRGAIQVTNDSAGNGRVVNDVLAENFLRGVVPREVSTSWGNAGGGAGINALRAQAVAARSYGLADNRYVSSGGYATTCDTTACQSYGGAAYRRDARSPLSLPSDQVCEAGNVTFECANTNRAVVETGRKVRLAAGRVVATEFSASNGPRTAGGSFPAVDDPADDVATNPNHRWTRVLDADTVTARYGLGTPVAASTERDPATRWDGVWGNRVRLAGASGTKTVSAVDFRSAFGLPSHGFTIRVVHRDLVSPRTFAMIGDSVGVSMTENGASELPTLLDRSFTGYRYDSLVARCTACGGNDGLAVASSIPYDVGIVVVQLGYNDAVAGYDAKIDQLMTALRGRRVGRVIWVNLADRGGTHDAGINAALARAPGRWPALSIADWRAASTGAANNHGRWFTGDGVHLTATGQASFALYVRDQVLAAARTLPR